jgi:folate-dependent tRNA-U54 methylase TrmFO/GidA
MRYIMFILVVAMLGCSALEHAEETLTTHQEELCYAETIGMDDYDSQIQFDECMTRD